MRNASYFALSVALLFLAGCNPVEVIVKNSVTSPSGGFKIVIADVSTGATTEEREIVAIASSSQSVDQNTYRLFSCSSGEVTKVEWINDRRILIHARISANISIQVVQFYEWTIDYSWEE